MLAHNGSSGVMVIGGEGGSGPNKMRLFKNREHMTFDDVANMKADQEFEVTQDDEGILHYPTKVVLFSNVHHLSIQFPSNHANEDETKIYYVGLRGDFTEGSRVGVVNAVYEARPMAQDHKADVDQLGMGASRPGF